MKSSTLIGLLLFQSISCKVFSQEPVAATADSLSFRGLLMTYVHVNPSNSPKVWMGGRYIPQMNYQFRFQQDRMLDFEGSANIYGNLGIQLPDSFPSNGKIKPYRLWTRYSTNQFELRLGLQKINFGSASMLRPLMWFDQIDPRDPLRLTDGVWGLLGRYYFLNNANIWLWALYGNKNTKGWEQLLTHPDYPELGARAQLPLPHGEAALTYHFRIADSRNNSLLLPEHSKIQENRIGIDARFDFIVGLWLEAAWVHSNKTLSFLTDQEFLNLGMDYTIGVGNGLYLVYEHLLASFDASPFEFSNPVSFSLFSASYPIGLFDSLNSILYYDWKNKQLYSFLNWQKQYNNLSFYIMAYWNPEDYQIPLQGDAGTLFAGKGIQIMVVYNH